MFKNFNNFKNKVALFDDKQEINYREILDYSSILKQTIKKNSLVLLMISNSLEGLKIYSSLMYNNTTTIIIDESFGINYVFDLTKKYKVNYLFVPKKLINISKEQNILNEGDNYFLILKNKFNHKINKKNLVLLPTSGTTANPKFVRLSEKNLAFNTKKIIESLSISKKQIAYTSLPSGFSFGLSIINTHLNIGAKIFVTKSSIVEKKFWENLSKYRITSLYGVPSMFKFICISKLYNKIPNNIKYLAQAGGKLDNEIIEKFIIFSKKKNKKFYVMYGQTEASPRISSFNIMSNLKKKYSVGKPFKQTKIELKETKKLRGFKDKEIIFFGKNVCLGYSKKLEDLKKGDINLGKLNTGDIGYKDKDGFYYVTGRVKRFAKVHGLRIDLDDVQNFLENKKIISEALIDNNFLKINLQNKKEIDKVKNILSKEYNLNKNYIVCLHNSNLNEKTKKKSWKNIL